MSDSAALILTLSSLQLNGESETGEEPFEALPFFCALNAAFTFDLTRDGTAFGQNCMAPVIIWNSDPAKS